MTQPLRAIVVDDEPLARDELGFLLGECGGVTVVGEAHDAPSALALADETSPDIAFVDLRMPGPDGIALAEALVSRHAGLDVVVVSAHDDGALRAFDARVTDYLLKPVRLERLQQSLARLKPTSPGGPTVVAAPSSGTVEPLDRIAVKRKGGYVVLDIRDIVYFEVRDDLVWAVTATDRFALDFPLSQVEERVGDTFFRSHRSTLVRLDRILTIEPLGTGTFELVLDHPEAPRVPLARDRARTLRERIPVAG
ncbi:MAG: response regulator transcription factor [Myxococcales bacterium]|nr:response regulator transcription factor [Myxococcales bacterium]